MQNINAEGSRTLKREREESFCHSHNRQKGLEEKKKSLERNESRTMNIIKLAQNVVRLQVTIRILLPTDQKFCWNFVGENMA